MFEQTVILRAAHWMARFAVSTSNIVLFSPLSLIYRNAKELLCCLVTCEYIRAFPSCNSTSTKHRNSINKFTEDKQSVIKKIVTRFADVLASASCSSFARTVPRAFPAYRPYLLVRPRHTFTTCECTFLARFSLFSN
jgi:hypothetical protein